MNMNFCSKTSGIWQFVGYGILLLKIVLPIVIIVIGVVELSKCVISGKDEDIKNVFKKLLVRIALAIAIFFIPTITKLVFGLIKEATNSMENAATCFSCILAPLNDDCKKKVAEAKANRELNKNDLYDKDYSGVTIDKGVDIDHKDENSMGNPEILPEDSNEEEDESGYVPVGPYASCSESYKRTVQSIEPNPLNVIACYPNKYRLSDYVDQGRLGAWPANHRTIPKRINNCGQRLLFPVVGSYGIQTNTGYTHHGLDIGWTLGAPIYAPASGVASFAWGTSINKLGGESNYSVSLTLSNPVNVTINGKVFTIKSFWFGHMLGVVSRENKTVSQGELLGYRGTTFNTSANVDAPHLHLTIKGSWEGSTELIELDDSQIVNGIQFLSNQKGKNINAGACF